MLRKHKARKRVLKYHEEKVQILGRRRLHFTYILFKKKKKKLKKLKVTISRGRLFQAKSQQLQRP